MEAKTFYLKTFGCQMNEHDSNKIAARLAGLGWEAADEPEAAGLVLFNTCTVRQKAHDKAFSEIGRVIASRNGSRRPWVGVCGCVAQEEGAKLLTRFPGIDLIFGPDQIYRLPELLEMTTTQNIPAVATELINQPNDYHFLDAVPALRLNGPSAYVTIMKGCNSRCAYCIVPKVRGSEVYRPAREIIREIEFLVEKGCREITLLGQNVNSYGRGSADGIGFARLVRLVAEQTGVERIRFTAPHPKDVDADLIEEYAVNPKLCSHIHLPLQSGSDAVLKRMRRAYNTQTYRQKVDTLRRARPDLAVTTDMIVGFPGEGEAEFQATLDFVQEMQFDMMFAFAYSRRPGTEAATFAEEIDPSAKEGRLQRLLDLQRHISAERNQRYLGRTVEVLVDGPDKRGRGKWTGRIPQNKPVNFAGQGNLFGAKVKVRVTQTFPHSLEGELDGG